MSSSLPHQLNVLIFYRLPSPLNISPIFYVFKALREITKEEKLLRKLNSKTHLSLSLDKWSRGDYLLTTLPGYAGEIVINYFQWMNDS